MPAGPGPITGSCLLAAFLFQSMGVGPLHCSSLPKGLAWSRVLTGPWVQGLLIALLTVLQQCLASWLTPCRPGGAGRRGGSIGPLLVVHEVPFMATACARPHLCWGEGLKALASLTCAHPILAGSPNGHDSGGARILTPAPHSCPRASPCDYG